MAVFIYDFDTQIRVSTIETLNEIIGSLNLSSFFEENSAIRPVKITPKNKIVIIIILLFLLSP